MREMVVTLNGKLLLIDEDIKRRKHNDKPFDILMVVLIGLEAMQQA